MTRYAALLRAVNVGGVTVRMTDLKALCETCGFTEVRTYIASGNVVFDTKEPRAKVKSALEAALKDLVGKPVPVFLRTGSELAAVVAANPFADGNPSRVMAVFLDDSPPHDTLERVMHQTVEQIAPGAREIFIHYPDGMGQSKLRVRAAEPGTARNMNTVAKLAELAGD